MNAAHSSFNRNGSTGAGHANAPIAANTNARTMQISLHGAVIAVLLFHSFSTWVARRISAHGRLADHRRALVRRERLADSWHRRRRRRGNVVATAARQQRRYNEGGEDGVRLEHY